MYINSSKPQHYYIILFQDMLTSPQLFSAF